MAELTPYERDILIRTVLGEARGEGNVGMQAVAHVIQNRANSGQYPTNPADVALQNKQFSTWNQGEGGNNPQQFSPNSDLYRRAADIVDQVWSGQAQDPTNGALFYHTPQVSPRWSAEVNKHGTTQIGNHIFYNGRPVPPGDVPNTVASLTSTTPPRVSPNPVTPSPSLSAIRNAPPPLPRPRPQQNSVSNIAPSNAGDSLAMSPVMGGQQQGPMFDAAYDTRVGSMRMMNQPRNTGGIMVGASRPPAPVPAPVEDRITARNRAMTGNWTPARQLPPLPPSAIGQAPTTRSVPSVPMGPQMPPGVVFRNVTPAQELAMLYQNGGPTRPPTSSPPRPQVPGFSYAGLDRFPTPGDRLMPQPPGLPANYGTFTPQQVAQVGVPVGGDPRIRIAGPGMPPLPLPRPNFQRPQAPPPRAMPPIPRPRPQGLGQPRQQPSQRPPLEVLVQGSNTAPPPRPQAPRGFTEVGNGTYVSNETGGVYYARHLN